MNSPRRITSALCACSILATVSVPADAAVTPEPAHAERPGEAPHPPYPFVLPPAMSGERLPLRGPYINNQANIDPFGQNITGDAANEPSIAVDPTNPNRIAIGWRQFDTIQSNFRKGGWAFSTDAGNSWTFPGVVHPTEFASDPVLSFDRTGKFYYYSLQPNRGPGDWACYLYQSADGGATWPQDVYAFGGDKLWMTVDRTDGLGQGNIYSVWTPNTQASCCGPNRFTRSTDGGLTFDQPIPVPGGTFACTIDVGPEGEVYVFGTSFTNGALEVSKSTDAQDPLAEPSFEFSEGVFLDGIFGLGGGPNPAGLLGQAWIATDHSDGPTRGNVYALSSVFRFSVNDPLDVMFARSTDGGQTWSAPLRVNDDPVGNLAYQWFGTLSVAPNGRIDVFWNDTRNDPTVTLSELYYSYSTDGGLTFAPSRPVSRPFNHFLGYPQQNKLGDYYHSISDNDGVDLAWAATFNGEQDVYHLRVHHRHGDADEDGDVDLDDFAAFATCATAPGVDAGAQCVASDTDGDGDVDLIDFGTVQASYTGSCAPMMAQQPADTSACLGGEATFEVQAQGAGLTYQWHHDWINIPGATSATLQLDSISLSSRGNYGVTVQSSCGVVLSENANLSINPIPQFVTQPVATETCLGATAEFHVEVASGTPPITLQWQFNGQDIAGATEPTLVVDNVTPENLGLYRCVATDGCPVTLISISAALTVPEVSITSSPIGGEVCVGGSIFLFTSTQGGPDLQWFKNDVAIDGATQSFLAIGNVTAENSGSYTVIATGTCNTVTSDAAIINVIDCN